MLNYAVMYSIVFASLFFSTNLYIFTMIFQNITITTSYYFALKLFPENFDKTTPWYILAISNNIQFILVSIIFIIVSKKAIKLLQSIENNYNLRNITINKLKEIIEQSKTLTKKLNITIKNIFDYTSKSKKIAMKISEDINSLNNKNTHLTTTIDTLIDNTDFIYTKNNNLLNIENL